MIERPTLRELSSRTEKYAEIIDLLAGSLNPPLFYHSGNEHYGFRYGNPDGRHFCILKSVRMVSCLNACIALAENGFPQEIYMLIRTFVEADAHIRYVLGDLKEKSLAPDQLKFVADYFADYQRNEAKDFKRPRISQKKIHNAIGEILDLNADISDPRQGSPIKSSTLMSNIYLTSSNYVHARYPEIMDMFGGNPGKFHMAGMSGTSKDLENINAISTFLDSVPLLLRSVIMKFEMQECLKKRPDLVSFLKS